MKTNQQAYNDKDMLSLGLNSSVTESTVFEGRNLIKRYGDAKVLDGVNVEISPGQVKAIIGRSGSGKSTLLRMIALLEELDDGSMMLNGRLHGKVQKRNGPIRQAHELERVKQRVDVGMVFQHFNLFPHLTALENVMLALRVVQGLDKEEVRSRAESALKDVGLEDRAHGYPKELSGGQQQRVAIARAVVLNPRLMLFDEPTSALDPELVQDVLGVIENLASAGMTMLIVTHELAFARKVADRILMFESGKIVEEGPPSKVLDDSAVESTRRFLQHVAN